MAIKVECGDCGNTYKVKDEMDGKKIRCKECSAVIVVQAENEDDWGEEEEDSPPPIRKASKSSKKKRSSRRSSSGGLPAPILIALICLALVIGLSVLDVIGNMMADAPNLPGPNGGAARKSGQMMGGILRIVIQGAIFVGILNGSPGYRIPAIVMGVLSSLLFGFAAVGLMLLGIPDKLVFGILALMVILRVIIIGCLLTPSASDHFSD